LFCVCTSTIFFSPGEVDVGEIAQDVRVVDGRAPLGDWRKPSSGANSMKRLAVPPRFYSSSYRAGCPRRSAKGCRVSATSCFDVSFGPSEWFVSIAGDGAIHGGLRFKPASYGTRDGATVNDRRCYRTSSRRPMGQDSQRVAGMLSLQRFKRAFGRQTSTITTTPAEGPKPVPEGGHWCQVQ
jgi:hypothetical protein